MNKNQKKVVWWVSGLLALTIMFPTVTWNFKNNPRTQREFFLTKSYGEINLKNLFAEWAGILIIGGLVFIALKDD